MKRLFAAGLAVTLIGGASYFVFRASPDRGVLFKGPVSNPTRIADLCDLVTLQGPASFCIRPDGGQVALQADGGATLAMTLTGGPTGHTLTQLPCGDDGCLNSSTTLTSASTYWRSAVVAPPSGSFTVIEYGTETQIGVNNANYIGNPSVLAVFNGNPYPVATVYYPDAGYSNILTGALTMYNGAPHMVAFTYEYSGPTGNVGKLYLDGVLDSTNSSLYAPLGKAANASWGIGKNGVMQTITGDVFGAVLTETALTPAQVQAIAKSLGVYAPTTLQGSFGEAMTFTRASAATCVDSTGQSMTVIAKDRPCYAGGYLSEPAATNKAPYSEAIPSWNKQNAVSDVVSNAAVAPDGTLTADTVLSPNAAYGWYNTASVTSSVGPFTFSGYGWSADGGYHTSGLAMDCGNVPASCACAIADGGTCTASVAGNSCITSASFSASPTRESLTVTCGSAVTGVYPIVHGGVSTVSTGAHNWWGLQLETGTVATSYVPTGAAAATRAVTGLTVANPLVGAGTDPAATNILLQSAAMTTSPWAGTGSTRALSTDVTAPDGSATTLKVTDDTGTNVHRTYNGAITHSVATYTWSVYAKAGTDNWVSITTTAFHKIASFNVATCTVGAVSTGSGVQAVSGSAGGWCRLSFTHTAEASEYFDLHIGTTQANVQSTIGVAESGTGTVYFWGPQIETGSVATRYIPTGSAAVSRAVNTPYEWCIGATVLPTGGVWLGDNSIPGVVALGNSATANGGSLFVDTSGLVTLDVRDAAGAYLRAKATSLALSATTAHTVYGCSNSGALSLWADGVPVAATISSPGGGGTGFIATQSATAIIGSVSTGQTMLNGTISNVQILNRGRP